MTDNSEFSYYNIDFELKITIEHLKDFFIQFFSKSNIGIFHNSECFSHYCDNKIDEKFDVCLSITDLTSNGIDDFKDIKSRTLLCVPNDLNLTARNIVNLLHFLSKALPSKIYISMTDLEPSQSSIFDFCFWCIDGNKRKIMFDVQEYYDDFSCQYCDYLLQN